MVDVLFYVPPIVCGGSVLVFVLVCTISCCPFLFCNHLDQEEGASCFTFICFFDDMLFRYSVVLPHYTKGWFAMCDYGIT